MLSEKQRRGMKKPLMWFLLAAGCIVAAAIFLVKSMRPEDSIFGLKAFFAYIICISVVGSIVMPIILLTVEGKDEILAEWKNHANKIRNFLQKFRR